jgi:tRNA(adenine34) deaminase
LCIRIRADATFQSALRACLPLPELSLYHVIFIDKKRLLVVNGFPVRERLFKKMDPLAKGLKERAEMDMNGWAAAEQVLRKAKWGAGLILLAVGLFFSSTYAGEDENKVATELDALEKQVFSLVPDPHYPQDRFVLITLQEAIAAKREGSGGIGACLIRESTGEVVMRGHNRQFAPYWRSDMHAEMDLMNRYEDSMRILKNSGRNPRNLEDLVLFSSVEPCPMCLTRIINTGLKKAYYAATDPAGGMVHKLEDLPSFWKEAAKGNLYAEANCSPAMKEIADRLFKHGMRLFKKQ